MSQINNSELQTPLGLAMGEVERDLLMAKETSFTVRDLPRSESPVKGFKGEIKERLNGRNGQ